MLLPNSPEIGPRTVAAAARKGTILDTIRPKDVQKQTIASVSLPGVNIAAAAEITPVELSFRVPSDITLRAKAWGKPPVEGKEMGGKRCILAIHGWLDNANSFDLAAPLLAAKGAYVVCLDLAGHGLSDHRQAHGGYYIWDMMDDILGVVDELNWPTFSLLGHSTGGHIAAFFTGTYPARVQRLIMLESIGTAIQFQGDPPAEMAAFIHRRREINKWGNSTRVYDSFEDAARARMNGFTKVNLEAARLLCERGLEPVVDDLPATPASSSSSSSTSPSAPQPHRRHPPIQGELRYIWRTDPRLTLWAFLHTPEALLLRFFKAIICPVAVIAAEGSTIWDLESSRFKARLDSFRHLTKVVVPGGHHMHMERECVGEVVKAMGEFLELEGSETA
ncbi:hypothetical protein HK104_009136 [Borealophlyctis nickersoniae]|nr:hypothetical protein HK104_009136 [Borealophlyctis nickersoniae]